MCSFRSFGLFVFHNGWTCSIGLRWGDRLGHWSMFYVYDLRRSPVVFAVCLGSSTCTVKHRPISAAAESEQSIQSGTPQNSSRHVCQSSSKRQWVAAIPVVVKHAHTIILPPPCLTHSCSFPSPEFSFPLILICFLSVPSQSLKSTIWYFVLVHKNAKLRKLASMQTFTSASLSQQLSSISSKSVSVLTTYN